MRKNYIDNLRTIVILLLFPYHTCRMFTVREANYVQGHTYIINDIFCFIVGIWFMNLLFVLAGMSAYNSIQKRSLSQFYTERVKRTLIPFMSGLIVMVPIQTYYAEKWHNHYSGNYITQYKLFFTKFGDLTGYFGGFTPAHLWFLLSLFLISLVAYPFLHHIKKDGYWKENKGVSMLHIILFFIVFWVTSAINIGKPIVSQFCYFVIGLVLFSKDSVIVKLQKYRKILFVAAIVTLVTSAISNFFLDLGGRFLILDLALSAYQNLAAWLMILSLLAMGRSHMNGTNRFLQYMRNNSFSIYFLHQTLLILFAYYIISYIQGTFLQYLLILVGGMISSFLFVEIIKKIPILSNMFGIK